MTAEHEQIDAYDFDLPDTQIAAEPARRRDESRLLELRPDGEQVHHERFGAGLLERLRPGDLLVVNDVRVTPARLSARKPTGGRVEIMLLNETPQRLGERRWRCAAFVRSRRPVRAESSLTIVVEDAADPSGDMAPGDTAPGERAALAHARVADKRGDGASVVELTLDGVESIDELLAAAGELPLPPYIVKQRRTRGEALYTALDERRYQTVYAAGGRAVAAPTAGLHFTDELLEALEGRGVHRAALTLDVGPGTFRPVRTARLDDHEMHAESYVIGDELAAEYRAARERGGRVVAVGTTALRGLEDQMRRHGEIRSGRWQTKLFIRPGETVRSIDGLITNFHLPRSTLIVLVAAIAGYGRTMDAYRAAVREGYRFYSYGDSMLVWPGIDNE